METDKMIYDICLGASSVLGVAVGAMGGGPVGAIIGAGAGYGLGVAHCKFTAPALKKKIFSEQSDISGAELEKVLSSIRRSIPSIDRSEAMKLFAGLRIEIAERPWLYRHV
jgi:hypothetical protein